MKTFISFFFDAIKFNTSTYKRLLQAAMQYHLYCFILCCFFNLQNSHACVSINLNEANFVPNATIELSWFLTSGSADDISEITVTRAQNSSDFLSIATLNGLTIDYTDEINTFGITYNYRLEIICTNGELIFSNPIEIYIPSNDCSIDLGSDITLCEGDVSSIDLPDAFELYEWSTGDNASSIIVGDNIPGIYTYSVTVTDFNGCTAIGSTDVIILPLPDASFFYNDLGNGSYDFIPTNNLSSNVYAWEVDDMWISNNPVMNYPYTFNSSITVALYVTNIEGCTNAFTQTVNFLSDPCDDTIINESEPYCINDTTVYELSLINDMPLEVMSAFGEVNIGPEGIISISYAPTVALGTLDQLQIITTNGCNLTYTLAKEKECRCIATSSTITVQKGIYLEGETLNTTGLPHSLYSPAGCTEYFILTDINGHILSYATNLLFDPAALGFKSSIYRVYSYVECPGTFYAGGAVSPSLMDLCPLPPCSASPPIASDPFISDIGSVNAGCKDSSSVKISYLKLSTRMNNCNGSNDGYISAADETTPMSDFLNSAPEVSYEWSTGEGGPLVYEINNLSAGFYSVTLTSLNNPEELYVEEFQITEPDPISIATTINDSTIDISTFGGTSPYTYLWSDGSTNEDLIEAQNIVYDLNITDNNNCTINFVIDNTSVSGLFIKANAILEGAYDSNSNTMHTLLFDNNLLPFMQPYNTAPWYYEGIETLSASYSNIVDWVLLEARSANDSYTIIAQKAALLLSDGSIVSADMISDGVYFDNLTANQSYYLSVKHRNHIGLLSATPINVPNIATFYFSDANNLLGSNTQGTLLNTTTTALISSDYNSNGIITVFDFNGYITETAQLNSYNWGDYNLDGNVTVIDFNYFYSNASSIGIAQIRY